MLTVGSRGAYEWLVSDQQFDLVQVGPEVHRPEMKDLITLFWEQIERLGPEPFVGDNDCLNFVSSKKAVFAKVHDSVKALG